ncbi:MAG: response regulator transcription factor [Terriglobia bacterium]|jgi:DNA-binding NarL/FixJ family response regulator
MNKRREEIAILIADDHPVFREGLRKLLEAEPGFRVLGEAADGEQTLKLARQLEPEILLLDIRMPKLSGLEVLRELKPLLIQPRTIVFTAAVEKDQIVQALQLGARGIILKHSATDVLFEGIRCVKAGQYWVGHESVSDLVQALLEFRPGPEAAERRQGFGLTPRETGVIALIVAGYSNKDIATKFAISEHTVKHHLTNIFDKLGVSNRLELALFSIDHHLIDNVQMGRV